MLGDDKGLRIGIRVHYDTDAGDCLFINNPDYRGLDKGVAGTGVQSNPISEHLCS